MTAEIKKCTRCNKDFQSSDFEIKPLLKEFLLKTYYGILCDGCLTHLDKLPAETARASFPARGEPLTENLHYYIENGRWVFTEFYHILRGHCCKNRCRHCAYGFNK